MNLNHTLVLRTRNRHKWLTMTIGAYANFSYKGILLIVDDSDEDIFSKNAGMLNSHASSLRINHIHGRCHQNQERAERVLESTIDAYKVITTDYFSITSDDDFTFPEFIETGISYLDGHPDYSAFTGPEVKIIFDNCMCPIKLKKKPWHGCEYEDPLDRLYDYAKRPTLAYMGVCRTSMRNLLSKVTDETARDCFSRPNSKCLVNYDEELPWVMLVHISGKIKYSRMVLQGIRGIHNSPDRIENIHMYTDGKSLGSITDLVEPTVWKSIKESHEDLVKLVTNNGTKYSFDVVSDSCYRILWHLIRAPVGSGLFRSDVEISNYYRNSGFYFMRIRRGFLYWLNSLFVGIAMRSSGQKNIYKKYVQAFFNQNIV